MSKSNVIEKEIQELIQQIKNEYQEGVDYKFTEEVEGYLKKNVGVEYFRILSPRLKKFCRERFDFPPVANIFMLAYEKSSEEGEYFYYQVCRNYGYDSLSLWDDRFGRNKEGKCLVCGDLLFQKNGWMKWWDGKKGRGLDSPDPHVNGYFHPECAKKYFANKEQPTENNNSQRIKEKILRNLDKVCLDPIGYLANAEIVKGDIEKDYYKGNLIWKELETKVYKVEIEGEEIDLVQLKWEDKREIRNTIINEIKQNPQDWKIEDSNIYNIPNKNLTDSFKILRHKSGRRHWNVGIVYVNENWVKGKKDWAEIEALLKGQSLPAKNQTSEEGEEQIIEYFRNNDIHTITLDGDKLVIKYNSGKEKTREINSPQLQLIKEIVSQQKNQSLSLSDIKNTTNPSQPSPSKNNSVLIASLVIGGIIISGLVTVYLATRKKKK